MKTTFMALAAALVSAGGLYAEDAYIEATGTQAISLGRKMTPTTRWEVDFAYTDLTAQQRVFGVSSGKGQLALYISGGNVFSFGASLPTAGGYPTALAADTARHVAIGDGAAGRGSIVTGGVTNGTSAAFQVGGTSDYPLTVFAYASNAEGTSFGLFAKAKVYGAKVYESDELVMDLVPRVYCGEAGLYDRVGKGFYPSSVPGTKLQFGGDLDSPYIQSDGTQVINTGYNPKKTSKFVVDYAIEAINASYSDGGTVQARLIAAAEAADALVSTIYVAGTAGGTDANIAFCSGDGWTGNSVWTGKGFDTARRTAVLDIPNSKGQLYAGGALVADKSTGKATLDSTRPLGLFGQISADGRTGYYQTRMKLYGFRIYENGVLVRDYRPYVRNAVVGLLDAVDGETFLSSVSVRKPFTCGGAIEDDGNHDACLSSTGDQIVNPSYTPTLGSRLEVDFALNSHTGSQERIFGATRAPDSVYGLYCNGNTAGAGYFSFCAGDNNTGTFPSYATSVPVDLARHRAVIDFKKGRLLFITGSVTNDTFAIASSTVAPTWPLYLFGESHDKDSGTYNRSAVRIYSAKFYNDDVLVQHWLPYADGTAIGLTNVVATNTLKLRTDGRAAAVPFTVGGCGWGEGHAPFYLNPVQAFVAVDKTASLSAWAPAALGYQWYCDGVAIPGATETTLTVTWRKSRQPLAYTVKGLFDINGRLTEVSSEPALIGMGKLGLVLLFK